MVYEKINKKDNDITKNNINTYYTAHYQATIAGPSTACRGAEAEMYTLTKSFQHGTLDQP